MVSFIYEKLPGVIFFKKSDDMLGEQVNRALTIPGNIHVTAIVQCLVDKGGMSILVKPVCFAVDN